MERIENMACSHSVQRVISARVRIIQAMLYIAVAFFTLIGTMGGLYWGVLAVATLVFSSPNYPRASVDGAVYEATHDGDTSVFQVPAPLNADFTVTATTTMTVSSAIIPSRALNWERVCLAISTFLLFTKYGDIIFCYYTTPGMSLQGERCPYRCPGTAPSSCAGPQTPAWAETCGPRRALHTSAAVPPAR